MTAFRTLPVVVLAAVLVWGTVAACRSVTPAAPPVALRGQSCAECHVTIARQWARSPHADAWEGSEFVTASKGRTESACLPCHAPAPLLEAAAGVRPTLRDGSRHTGIDCNACHQVGCDLAGPYCTWGPHGMRAEPERLRSNDLCSSCHEAEARQYDALYVPTVKDDAQTCIECHMPATRDRLTQGSPLSQLHPPRTVRDHSLLTWGTQADAAIEHGFVTHETSASGSVVIMFSLTNVGAGHRIPTGEHGYRELRIRVTAFDASEQPVGTAEDALLSELGEGLEPGVPRPFRLELDASAPPVRVTLEVERVNLAGDVLRSFVYAFATLE